MDEQKKRKLTLTQLTVFFLAFFHASSFAGLRCQRSFRMVSLQFAQVLNNYAKPCHLVRTKSCKAGNGGSCRKPARRTPLSCQKSRDHTTTIHLQHSSLNLSVREGIKTTSEPGDKLIKARTKMRDTCSRAQCRSWRDGGGSIYADPGYNDFAGPWGCPEEAPRTRRK